MIDNTLLYKKSMAEMCTQRGHYLTKVGRNRTEKFIFAREVVDWEGQG